MTSNEPGDRPAPGRKGAPPVPSRRSARQERYANRASRQASRALEQAATQTGRGGLGGGLVLWTAVAVVAAVAVIGAAVLLTRGGGTANPTGSMPAIHTAAKTIPPGVTEDGRTLGSPDAKVTIDLWSDFQCTYCGQFAREYEPQLVDQYIATGKVKLVYHDFIVVDAMAGGTSESLDAANAALCANDQGKFWPYHDVLFWNQVGENVGEFTKARLLDAGRVAGLDMTKFQACVDGNSHYADVRAEKPPDGLTGTPGIYVNGTFLGGGLPAYSDLTAAIEGALSASSPSPSATASATPSASPSTSASPSPSASAS